MKSWASTLQTSLLSGATTLTRHANENIAVVQSGRDLVVSTYQGAARLADWYRAQTDVRTAIIAILQSKLDGFMCLNAEALLAVACEFTTHVVGFVLGTAETSGAVAGISAAEGTTLAARGALALQAGLNAAKALIAAPLLPVKGLVSLGKLAYFGSSPEGIGEVYRVAKELGFETTGIESTLALKSGHVSPFVDHAYVIKDEAWGGFKQGSHVLTPTSEAMVGVSDMVIGIGGGDVGRDELIAIREAGKAVTFFPADMDHKLAISKALKKGIASPSSFAGAAQEGLQKLPVTLALSQTTSSAAIAISQGCVAKALGSLLNK